MKTMTLDEVKKLPPLTEAEIKEAISFKNTDFSDCPKKRRKRISAEVESGFKMGI